MSILDDLTSGDSQRIWQGACAIRHLYDHEELMQLAGHLAQIRDTTRGVALGGALHPNASHLAFAIGKLEFVKDVRGCLCALYERDHFYNPVDEEKNGRIRILGTTFVSGPYVDFYDCECVTCGARYRVIERDYHYTWWGWARVSSGP